MTIVEVKGRSVKIGFNFPPEATIMRKELHDRITTQNLEAAQSSEYDDSVMDALDKYNR